MQGHLKLTDTVLFRVDAGRIWGVSYGHVFRCLSLAEELQRGFGMRACFAMRDRPEGIGVVIDRGLKVIVLGDGKQVAATDLAGVSVVVFDLLTVDPGEVEAVRSAGIKAVILNSSPCPGAEADVIVSSGLSPIDRPAVRRGSAGVCYEGPKYIVLDPSYDHVDPIDIRRSIDTVVVSMGGSDPTGLTMRIIGALKQGGIDANLVVVLGPGCTAREQVECSLRGYKGQWSLVSGAATLAPILSRADLAILAGGRTTFEAAFLGVPGIVVPSIQHEERLARAFAAKGGFLSLDKGWRLPDGPFERDLLSSLVALRRRSLRKTMSVRLRQLVDGHGRKRVARLIHDCCREGDAAA